MSVKLDMLVEVEEQASDKSLSSDADSDSSMLAFVPPIPPSLPKFVAATLFTACLNWADFFSDWYVVLQYACIINSDMTAGCGSGELQACEAHPWWFATGLSLLVISNLVQSCFWAFGFFFFLEEQAWGRFPATFSGQLALSLLLILLAFAQLHYLVDIAAACIVGAPDPEDRIGRYFAMIFRDMAMKILESGPQLYLQSYILFAVGSHGDPVKLASVAISIAALGHGVVKGASTIWSHLTAALSKTVYWMMTFLWFSSDQALKSAGYALVLAPGARPYGMALMAIAALASCGLTIHSDNPKHVWLSCSTVVRGMLLFFAVYLVPCLALAPLKVVPALLVRWVENAACALLAYSFAVTSCGHAPTNEVLGLFGLLLFNVLCYLIRYFCFDHETGDFLCFGRGTLQEEGGKEGPKNLNTRPSTTCEAGQETSSDSAPLRLATVALAEGSDEPGHAECVILSADDAAETAADGEAQPSSPFEPKAKEKKRRMVKRRAKKGSAGAAVHDVGASTVEDENAGTIDVTLPAGDAVEAGTGSTPTTPRSQTGKKTKATVKRKAKRRQHAAGSEAQPGATVAMVLGSRQAPEPEPLEEGEMPERAAMM